jgi:hypothetical protein
LLPAHFSSTISEESDPPSPKDTSVEFHVPLLLGLSEANGENNEVSFMINGLPRPSSLTALLAGSTSGIHRAWRQVDDAYMRPLFGGKGFVRQMSRPATIPENEALEDSDSQE